MSIENQIKKREYFAYCGVTFGQNILYASISGFLMLYYTNVVEISAITVGTTLFLSKFWDAVNDPLMGFIIDKARLKKGKFIPWIRYSTFLLPIVFFLLFQQPFEPDNLKIMYILVSYFIFDTVYTLGDAPIYALSTVISDNLSERTKFLSYGRLAAIISSLVPSFLFPIAIQSGNWSTIVLIMSGISFILMAPLSFIAKERVRKHHSPPKSEPESKQNKETFRGIIKNKYLTAYLSSFFLMRMFAVASVASSYFYSFVIGQPKLLSIVSIVSLLPAIILALSMPFLVKKIGKRSLYISLHIISILSSISCYVIGYGSPLIVIGLSIFSSLAVLSSSIMNGLFVSDCIDYGYHRTGVRQEGMFFSIQTFVTKAATAMVAMFGGWMLEVSGYQANISVSPDTSNGLFRMLTLIPMIGVILSLVIFTLFYRLDETTITKLRNADTSTVFFDETPSSLDV